ncbi:MAG: 2-amino-4-hydroxy-6-hydroxymethyldihydropteridine diphosphokinase [Planctomycetes bacterium]|nr:2-amino-4-hydroxy-6-hydroxymethyldihydropteridine diphosphokinase [Planctomycetota bacterium]
MQPVLVDAYVALGSNLGDRRGLLDAALQRLRLQPGVDVISVSSYYETEPVGGPAKQGDYLNAAAHLRTTLSAFELLRVLQAIESQLGRVRAERFGPRTIDLDLLLFGLAIVQADELTVPHPRMQERLFVLEPLAEIAPLAVHPILRSTVADLDKRLREAQGLTQFHRELLGQNAVVVGSTRGIGRAIALALADAGANLLVHGRRATDTVAAECRAKGVQIHAGLADLNDDDACTRLITQAWQAFPSVDIWIQSAGADTLTGDAATWPFERKLQELWGVDVRAAMLMTRAVGARMKQQGHGVIVTMGWDQAETGMEGDSGQLFAATKGAMMAYTKSLALNLAPEVRVNCLAPGWIRTAWGEQASAAWQARVRAETPLQRWGTPEDVAAAACWLVSPAARFITGQIIRVNGGAVRG